VPSLGRVPFAYDWPHNMCTSSIRSWTNFRFGSETMHFYCRTAVLVIHHLANSLS
jgi:hypothetical protein